MDTLNDFVAGGAEDKIVLIHANTGYANFAAMQTAGAIVQSGADTLLNLDPGGGSSDQIILLNVTAANLAALDFQFRRGRVWLPLRWPAAPLGGLRASRPYTLT